MFEAETRSVILERLKKYYAEFKGTDVSAVEGTFSFDTLAANAKEFEKAYAEMDLMMDAAFPQTSWGIYLDRLADELAGLSRKAATPAVVTLSITRHRWRNCSGWLIIRNSQRHELCHR